jgi:hypothetical protein
MTTVDMPPNLQSHSQLSQYVALIQACMAQSNAPIAYSSRSTWKQEKQISRQIFQTLKPTQH